MKNWFKNILSRRIKAKDRNVDQETSLDISGVDVDAKGVKAGIGGISKKKASKPSVMTEDIAKKNLQHGQTSEIIEGINDPEKRDEIKLQYAATLIEERASETQKKTENRKVLEIDFDCSQINSFLAERGFMSLFLPNELCCGGNLLWPMNVQDGITYIHIAQFNLARLFINAGWSLKVIIGDCGHNSSKGDNAARNEFIRVLDSFLQKNGLNAEEYSIISLSEYFIRSSESADTEIDQGELLNQFHVICDSVLWRDYKSEILKEYDDTTKYKIEQRKILNNIQPLLMWSVVATINQYCITSSAGKVLVLAGQDEFKQWQRIVDTRRRNNLGAIFIQELKTADSKTMDQTEIGISNKAMLQEKINSNENLAKWLFLHFIELPSYGKQKTQFPFCNVTPQTCKNYNGNCMKCLFIDRNYDTGFDKSAYVTYMYPLINAAN